MQKGNLSIQLKHSYSFQIFLFFLRRIITCWGYVICMPCAWSMTKPEIAKGRTGMPTLRNSSRDRWFQYVQSGRLFYCFVFFSQYAHMKVVKAQQSCHCTQSVLLGQGLQSRRLRNFTKVGQIYWYSHTWRTSCRWHLSTPGQSNVFSSINGGFLKKLTVTHLVKKYLAFYGMTRLITMFTRIHRWSVF
jgi:hypothetical protein